MLKAWGTPPSILSILRPSSLSPAPTAAAMSTTTVLTDARTRIVHFDNECVIIPDPEPRKNRPKIVTKSYSLPLWKRRTSPSPVVPAAPGVSELGEREAQTPMDEHVVVKLPLPRCVPVVRYPHSSR